MWERVFVFNNPTLLAQIIIMKAGENPRPMANLFMNRRFSFHTDSDRCVNVLTRGESLTARIYLRWRAPIRSGMFRAKVGRKKRDLWKRLFR
jgi:hypothetical protein